MLEDTTPAAIEDLAALADPMRRRLYLHIAAQPDAVDRDQAAAALSIGRPLATHHLERLVAAGLLVPEYRRRSGRTGPGAGRPAKLYRVADRELRASLPARRYEVAADLFASTLDMGGGLHTLEDVAHQRGTTLGAEARSRAGKRAGAARRMEALASVLADAGYAPLRAEGELRLVNCPFHELAQRHRQVTCGMNLQLLRGALDAAGLPEELARLDPQPGTCCVKIREP
ncbi:MAG TPA: transcriptional regulator [Candidatus Limnocylindria bacterium]|nr:transcriptional regulator [Candidatus Limnocylindria bacterium]